MKRSAMNHTKLKRLSRELKVPLYAAVGILESLWHLTAREAPAGNIGKLSDDDIAASLDWERPAVELTSALVASNWVDQHPQHRLIIHDWHEHSDDTVDNQLARSIQRYASGAMPRMARLPKDERERIRAQFTHASDQERIRAHGSVVASTEKPLPEPVPVPAPEPGPSPAPEPSPKASPLPPTTRGVQLDPTVSQMWQFLKAQLKQALNDVPLGLAKRFTPIQANQTDYDSCFRDWWLEGMHRTGSEVQFATVATHPALSRAGVDRYGGRLEQVARKVFGLDPVLKITFTVRPSVARQEVA